MNTKLFTTLTEFTKQYSPEILSGLAVAGVITTTVLAIRATPKAVQRLDDESIEKNKELKPGETTDWQTLTPQEIVKSTWTYYIPTAISGGITITCIIASSRIGHRRNAALVAGAALADRAFQEYREEVKELIGARKELEVQERLAQKGIDANPVSKQVIITGGGEQDCYERLTGRYFRSDIETIRRAENEINAHIIHDMYASQNEFYALIGLPDVDAGDELGWNMDHLIKVIITSHIRPEDGVPCIAIGYEKLPIPHYGKVF